LNIKLSRTQIQNRNTFSIEGVGFLKSKTIVDMGKQAQDVKKTALKQGQKDQKDVKDKGIEKDVVVKTEKSGPSKTEISGFLTSAKKTNNQNLKEAYDAYISYGRFDARKAEIIAKWKRDKSCKWVNEYKQTIENTKQKTTSSLQGHGTRN